MTATFWREHGHKHLTPAGKDNPEGWDVWAFLPKITRGSVVEIGCGAGRLARAFDPSRYLGTDINPRVLEEARRINPEHMFEEYAGQSGETALLYTVLLHISDDDLPAMIDTIAADRVVVAEIMGRRWRREGNPPVYNREPDEYAEAFTGRTLMQAYEQPYRHYKNTAVTFLVFE